MNISFDLLEDLANEVGGDIDATYSGRAMYGKSCVGISLDSETDLLALGAAIASIVEAEDSALGVAMMNGARLDSMGRGIIVYWPSISCGDAPAEDEDDEDDDE